MDTPDKKTQPSPSFLSKFEDSPVFNYISTLSPIKSFSVGHNAPSFHLLNFSSPQALHATPTNYLKEPKITRISDAKNGDEVKIEDTSDAIEPAHHLQTEEVDKNNREVTVRSNEESSKLVFEEPRSLKYERDSAENNVVHCDTVKPHDGFDLAGMETIPVKVFQDNYKEADCLFENGRRVQMNQMKQNKEACEWEKFVSEASGILNRHSPTKENYSGDLDDRSADSGMLSFVATVLQPPNEHINDLQSTESDCPVISENQHTGAPLNKLVEIGSVNERSHGTSGNSHALLAEKVVQYMKTETDDKSCSQQQQMTRRRCLVYEMSGSHYRKLLADSTGSSPTKPAASSSISIDKSLMVSRPGSNRFSSALPGIGLHLNALAAAAKDKIVVRRQTLTCRRQLISSPRTTSTSDSQIPDTKPLITQTAPEVMERESDEQKDRLQVSENASENSIFGEGIEVPQSSPKKKRRKSENVGETDSCKRCNCKRSKCLKLYCECFAAGLYCVEPCNCQDCFNKPVHEETVLETRRQIESRNPLAFAPKVIKCSGTPNSVEELNKTPASARHKRGCNCKKSGCLKKYCECFQGGVGCSLSCRCEGCKNTFGRKEGTESIVFQETKFLQRNASEVRSHDNAHRTDEENHDEATPELSNVAREPVRRPFHFGGTAPHFPSETFLQSCTSHNMDKSDEMAFEEDELKITGLGDDTITSEDLKGDYLLPTTYVKSTSPNCKRISPPHCDFETSPGWRSCRKLILRSIPPLPTFTPEKERMDLSGKLQ